MKGHEIKAQVQEKIESVDREPKGEIDKREKKELQELFRNAEKLRAILKGEDVQKKAALYRAMSEVALGYKGLTEEEIERWIRHSGVELPEIEPGSRRLGKPPRKSEIKKTWERLSAKQKKEALLEAREAVKLTPTQQRRLKQLQLIITGVEGLKKMIEKGGKTIFQKLAFMFIGGEHLEGYKKRVTRFANEKAPQLSSMIIRQKDTPLSELMKMVGSEKLLDTFKKAGVSFEECQTSAQLIQQKAALVKWLRSIGDYEVARQICMEDIELQFNSVLKNRFYRRREKVQIGDRTISVPVIPKLFSTSIIRIKGKMDAGKLAEQIMEQDASITSTEAHKKAKQFINALVYQDYLHMEHEAVAEMVDNKGLTKKWTKAKRTLWEQYKDSMGVGAFNLSDENWDMVIDEITINAPLIIVSGGVAAGARAVGGRAFSWGARAVIGAARIEKISVTASRVGRLGGLAFEGMMFDITNEGMRGRWLFNSPDWAQRIMWTSVALGMFKGAGKLGERLVSKKGALEVAMQKIKNPYVRKGVEELLVKGHLEVAAMLTLGAVQSGVYSGNLDEFFDNFGEELFHAYVAIGALKISGKGVKTAKKRLVPFAQKKVRRVKEKIKERIYAKENREAKAVLEAEMPQLVQESEKAGLHKFADVLKNFEIERDPYTGESIRAPRERLKFARQLQELAGLSVEIRVLDWRLSAEIDLTQNVHREWQKHKGMQTMSRKIRYLRLIRDVLVARKALEGNELMNDFFELSVDLGDFIRVDPYNSLARSDRAMTLERKLELLKMAPKAAELAKILEEKGLPECAEDMRHLPLEFSRVDGSPLRTLLERKEFMEKLSRLGELELEWYKTRPDSPPAPQNGRTWEIGDDYSFFQRQSNKLKEFSAKFISEKSILRLVESGKSLQEVILEIHRWQVRGSEAQLTILRSEMGYGKDISGRFRSEDVLVGKYIAPTAAEALKFVSLFSRQVAKFSEQLNARKNQMPKEAYELAVIKLACYVQQTFVDIHPMRDGNGRTSRSLYEYIIVKHLGLENKYRKLPTDASDTGEQTIASDLVGFNRDIQVRDYIGDLHNPYEIQANAQKVLGKKLKDLSLDELFNDDLISQYVAQVKTKIDTQ